MPWSGPGSGWRGVLAALALLIIAAGARAQDTWYVRVTGSDGANGQSKTTAFRTINHALTRADAGDTVYVGAGTYAEAPAFGASGTAGSPIRVVGDVSGQRTDDAGDVVVSFGSTLSSNGTDHVELEALTLARSGAGGALVLTNSDGWALRGCTVRGASGTAVDAQNGSTLAIERCVIHTWTRGVLVSNGAVEITSSVIRDTSGVGIESLNAGNLIRVYSCTLAVIDDDALVIRNGAGEVFNTIFYQPDLNAIKVENSGTCANSHNLFFGIGNDIIEGAELGPGSVTTDPRFVNAAGRDFHLSADSPAISAGASAAFGATDFDGQSRPMGAGWDIGADEYDGDAGPTLAALPYWADFEAATNGEWDQTSTEKPDGVNTVLGRFAAGESATLHVATDAGESYVLMFDLWTFDDWDGERFRVAINGAEVVSDAITLGQSNAVNGRTADFVGPAGGGADADRVWRNVTVVFTASGEEAEIAFSSTLDQSAGDESWGVTNVRVGESGPEYGLTAAWYDFSGRTSGTVTGAREPVIDWEGTTRAWFPGRPADRFYLQLSGRLYVPSAGAWQIKVTADDLGYFQVNGRMAIHYPAYQRTYAQYNGEASLSFSAPGEYQCYALGYDISGASEFRVQWKRPGSTSWEDVPWWAFRRAPLFTNATWQVGFAVRSGSRGENNAGLHWADLDADGDLDCLMTGNPGHRMLWNGTRFVASSMGNIRGQAALFDADHDGDLDFWRGYGWQAGRLYENVGRGSFTNRGHLGFTDRINADAAAAGDHDGDGDEDLYLLGQAGNHVVLNEGTGHEAYTPVRLSGAAEAASGMNDPGDYGNGDYVSSGDVNNDGRLDLFYHYGTGKLFLSRDDGTFEEGGRGISVYTRSNQKFGSAWGDYDNDGDLDLFAPDPRSTTAGKLYRNDAAGASFTDVTTSAGLTAAAAMRSCDWGDYDNDGDLDLYITTASGSANLLYNNLGDGTFALADEGVGSTGDHEDCAFADIDGDGDLDLAMTTRNGYAQLYTNSLNDGRALSVRVVRGGADAVVPTVGVRVELWDAANTTLLARRDIGTARGYAGSANHWAHFGGVEPTTRYTVRVHTPRGEHSASVVPIEAGSVIGATTVPRLLTIDESQGAVRIVRWREVSPRDD